MTTEGYNDITFQFCGQRLPYLRMAQQPDAATHIGERTIEIPIAWTYVNRLTDINRRARLVEVGAVTPYFRNSPPGTGPHEARPVEHTVIDPFDPYTIAGGPNRLRMDAANYDFTGMDVLCISTIEHIGLAEYGNTYVDAEKALFVLSQILTHAASWCITWPIGHHHELDVYGRKLARSVQHVLYRQSEGNRWHVDYEAWDARYGFPFPYGNGVVVLMGGR